MSIASPSPLAALAPDATFVPIHEVGARAHIVVDGPTGPGTVLGLSHWPTGGTPAQFEADTSTEIVARYLDVPHDGPAVNIVTNNHFDEDGLLAAFLLLEQPTDPGLRRAAIAAAEAGDFQIWTDPRAVWSAMTLMAMAERPTSPVPDVLRALNGARAVDPAGAITIALLPYVERVLHEPERYRRIWEPQWAVVERDMALIESGVATITEIDGCDLAVVAAPHPLSPFAVHPRIDAMRVLMATPDGLHALTHRYETWVRYISRPLPPRRDLTGVLPLLDARATRPGRWRFDGIDQPQARLRFTDQHGAPTPAGIAVSQIVDIVCDLKSPANR